ncbi:hypothetical protein D9615_001528 [Tricholomella constricta]|uniref:Fanconi-associated nuclease n=1 Tax=Tricholomella constricta TaxID=117010 RepID=A0A8H5HNM3_9AGAR|nr:hypothetical protein D9615_001528 [Tricholomella constricta]
MTAITPPAVALYELFYGAKRLDDDELEHTIEQVDSSRLGAGEQPGIYTRPSIYIEAFEQMVNTVYGSEAHLLTEKETNILKVFSNLSYNARYCLVRLILRKTNAWHTLASMEKFKKEVGENGLRHAIEALCSPLTEPKMKDEPMVAEISNSEVEIIDLTGDYDDEEEKKPFVEEAGSLRMEEQDVKPSLDILLNSPNPFSYEPNFDFFLEDESSMDLREALHRLSNDQLKDLVKETKTGKAKMNKMDMIAALQHYAHTQAPLGFKPISKNEKSGNDGFRQTILPFKINGKSHLETQERRLLQMVRQKLGKCVRVNIDLYWLVARLNVIYDRCTEYPKSLLVPSLLTSFKKRAYPDYKYTRSSTIWKTREEFLEYFEAMWLEAAIETELEPLPQGRPSTKTPAPVAGNKFVTPVPPSLGRSRSTPMRIAMSGEAGTRCTESPAVLKEEPSAEGSEKVEEVEVPIKLQTAQRVKEVFDEIVFPKWKELVAQKEQQNIRIRIPGLERFEPGFVYTRIFSKAMRALATLKFHHEEAAALDALLDQQFWRRGKRAKWYERRALLQMKYLCIHKHPGEGEKQKTDLTVIRQAMEGVHQALKDQDTGIVFRPGLVRRLRRLEKRLKVPEEERAICEGELRKASVVVFSAERLHTTSKSLKLDGNGRPMDGNGATGDGLRKYFSHVAKGGTTTANKENKSAAKNPSDNWKWKGKSIWRGINGEEINVETRALQHYEGLGYKGFHSESRILTTIFALLFWDIIFADVPGAFETRYQTAPLDLAEDSFYRARKESIDARLEDIKKKGQAQEFLRRHDDLYRENKTWCVGVRWDICEKQDLLEIVECLGGGSLSIICRLFCEDYAGRSSGVPDLIVWNAAKGLCKFVEVKGPGDRPQENQKLWFDSLLGAGADIEVCRVIDQNEPPRTKSVKQKKTRTRGGSSNAKSKGKGKGKARVGDSDAEMESDSAEQIDQLDDDPWGSPPPVLGKRCRRPPDENDDQLPTFHSTATPPTSPPNTVARYPGHTEIALPPPKRRKTASISP